MMAESPFIQLLREPAWQGVGALVAFVAFVAYLWFEVRRRGRRSAFARELAGVDIAPSSVGHNDDSPGSASGDEPTVRFIAIHDPDSERRFYQELIRCMTRARETFYRTGHGFQRDRQEAFYRELLQAEEDVLARGVEIVRIQTGGARMAATWAEGYASLLERFPGRIRVAADFDNYLFNDVGLIDPHGHDPIIYLLFETRERAPVGTRTRPEIAFFIEKARGLARILGHQFDIRAKALTTLTPKDVRDLANTYIYFAWGVHMHSRKMLAYVPDAHREGVALLRGWRRDISAMLAGPADRATIHNTGRNSDVFDGVAYVLSWWGKTRLDQLERRAYEAVPVVIEIAGQQRDAFTYVPLPSTTPDQGWSPGSWIDSVIEGASENGMVRLLGELRSAGVPLDDSKDSI